ncbi:UvrD-helicase domain-containing protein [Thermophagus sp. OGC60D27]|uniref:UvrD-helicase domain-containing protein n=1 Tax=Thermophagus sp. OGC60D27 TaxID=3458415 RepID=UPI00403846A4
MFFIADLHVHSRFSRATSKSLDLESLYQWARIKGINVIGTGDFTHPQWFREIKEKLEPDGNGFFRLKEPPRETGLPGVKVKDIDIRFCLSSEISSIYKYGDKVRKNHNLIFAPDLETVERINARLSQIGNLTADGRPILGLPSRDLLEIVTECSERACLIPAHVWTPWFSTLGSKGGYDSVEDCFRDLSHLIFALETGLSSDPAMNWHWSSLDRYALISNSDAHSPQKLGREATLFDTELSYDAMFQALKTRNGFLGTYEFYPQEGKYHMDGHRKCGVSLNPAETNKYQGICPVCGKPLTVGVLNRVMALSDRVEAQKPANAPDYKYIIPLPEILSEIKGVGPASKGVRNSFIQVLSSFGNEFSLLNQVPLEDIRQKAGPLLSEAIGRMRRGEVMPQSGFDGVYGVIKIFKEGEVEHMGGQLPLFGLADIVPKKRMKSRDEKPSLPSGELRSVAEPDPKNQYQGLNEAQKKVRDTLTGAVLVKAGPGTGKTGTMIRWIQNQMEKEGVNPSEIMAITFTNKAAAEIEERLNKVSGEWDGKVVAGTFHAIAWKMLRSYFPNLKVICDDNNRLSALRLLFPNMVDKDCRGLSQRMAAFFEGRPADEEESFISYVAHYREFLSQQGAADIADIIGQLVLFWKENPEMLEQQRERVKAIAVDEFQDINHIQYEFIRLLGQGRNILAIGDPDQSIYGFRGSDVNLFFRFQEEFCPEVISLTQNYRSIPAIVHAASAVIRNNSLRSDIALQPRRTGIQKISLFNAETPEQEAAFILREIEIKVGGFNLLSGGEAYDGNYAFPDIAVLYRTHQVGRQLLMTLKKANIPVVTADGRQWFSEPPFSILNNAIRLFLNPDDRLALEELLALLPGWKPRDVRDFMIRLFESNRDWRHNAGANLSGKAQDGWKQWLELYHNMPDILEKSGVRGLAEQVFGKYLSSDDERPEQKLQMETILTLASEAGKDARKFLEEAALNPFTNAALSGPKGVRLLTFHAAKGLEFPVVFLCGAEEGITPSCLPDSDREEERRLFYVAMTRARDELYISWAKKRAVFGHEQEQKPSSFIAEIPDRFIERLLSHHQGETNEDENRQLSLF